MGKTKKTSVEPTRPHLVFRPPVVVVLGHIDHGKTTLLDKLRSTHAAAEEPGGISQYLTASQVGFRGRVITFLDTPGHEAFTQMRVRGGQVADLALLVVSAVEGVKAQTQEVLSGILNSRLPLMVVLTKIDLPGADPRRVKEELNKNGVLLEGWGGGVVCLEVSGKTGAGIDNLLEMILLQTDLLELRADVNKPFRGIVLESSLDPKRGPAALILGKEGTLRVGQTLLAGRAIGKVKALLDGAKHPLAEARPSQPVEVLGFKEVPEVGEIVSAATPLSTPGAVKMRPRTAEISPAVGHVLNVVLRADCVGTLEALVRSLKALVVEGWRINLLSAATGAVSASDVLLAKANRSWLLSFNAVVPEAVSALARESAVVLRHYAVIYELLDAVKEELERRAKTEDFGRRGRGEIIKIFTLPSGDKVAGTRVDAGRLKVGGVVKLFRKGAELTRLKIKTIKMKTEKITSVAAPNECGVLLVEKWPFQVGDLLEEA